MVSFVHLNRTLLRRLRANECSNWSLAESKKLSGLLCYQGTNLNIIHKSVYRWSLLLHNQEIELKNVNTEYNSWVLNEELPQLGEETLEMFTLIPHLNAIMVKHSSHSLSILSKIVTFAVLHLSNKQLYFSKKLARLAALRPLSKRTSELYMIIIILTREPSIRIADQVVQEWSEHLQNAQSMESESVIKGQTSLGESNNNNNNNSNGNGNFAISRNDIINQANKFNDRLSEEYKSIELHEEDLNIVSNLLSIIFERMSDKEQIEKDDSAFYHNYSLNFATEEPFDLRIKNMIWMSTRHGVSTIERIHFIHLLSDLLYVLKISSLRSTTHFTEKVREGMIDLANNFVLFKSLPSILQRRQLSFRELELIYRVAASTVIEWSDVGLLALRRILHASWCKGTNPLSHLNIEDKLRMYVTIIVHMQRYSGLMEQEKLINLLLTSWPLFFDVVPSSAEKYKNITKNKEHELFSSEWVCWQDLPELTLSSDVKKIDITRLFFLVWIISNTMCLRREFTFDLTNEIYLNLEKLLNVCVHVLFIKAKEYEPYELDLSYVKKRQIRKAIHLFQANAAYMRFARMRCIARFQDSLAHFKNEREAYEFSLNALEACKQYYKSMLSTEQKHSKANSSTSLCSVEAKLLEPPTSSERPTIVVPSVIDIIEENPDKEIEDILGKPSEEESRYATATAAAAAKLEHNVNHKSNVKSDDNNTSKNSVNEEVNVEVGSIPTSRFSGFTADVMQMSDFIIGLLSHPYTANNPKLLKEAVEVYELYVEQLIMETHGRLSSIKVTLLSNALNFCMNDWEKFMQHLAYNQGEETYYRLRNKLKELAVVNLECFIEPSPMWMSSFNFVNQKSYNSATNQNFMSKVPFLATNKGKKVLHEVTFLLGRYMRALCMLSTLGISIDTLSDANVIEHNLITALKYVSTIETLEERNLVELIRFCTIVCDTGYLKENLLKAMLVALRKITNEAVIRNINDFFRARVLRDLWIMFNTLQFNFATMRVNRAIGRYIVAFITRLSLERVAYTGQHWKLRARRYGHTEEFSATYENIRDEKLLKVICAQRMLLFTLSVTTTMLRGVPLDNYLNSMLSFARRYMKTNIPNGANNQTLKVLKQENGYLGERTFLTYFNSKKFEHLPGTNRYDLEYILEANYIFLKMTLVATRPIEEFLKCSDEDKSVYAKRMHAVITTISTVFLANEHIMMPSTWYSFCKITCYFERMFSREGYFDELLHQTRIVALTRVLLYVKSRNNCGVWAGYRPLSERLRDNCIIWPQDLASSKMTEGEETNITIEEKKQINSINNNSNIGKGNYGKYRDDDDDVDAYCNAKYTKRRVNPSSALKLQKQLSNYDKIRSDDNEEIRNIIIGSGSKMKENGSTGDGVKSLHDSNSIVLGCKVEHSRETKENVQEHYRQYKKEMTEESFQEYEEEEELEEKLQYLEEHTSENKLLSRRVLSEYFTMQTGGLDVDVRQYLIELVTQQFDLMPEFFMCTPENLERSFYDYIDDRDERKRFAESCFVHSVEKDDKTGETHVVKKCKFEYLRASLTPNATEQEQQTLRYNGIDTFVISRALTSLHS